MVRAKNTGGLYQRASDKMWCASITLPPGPDGQRRRKVVARAKKADAIRELRRLRDELELKGDMSSGSSPTLNAWIDDWWERYALNNLKVSIRDDYAGIIRRYIRPSIGHIKIDRLEPKHVHRLHSYVTDTKGLTSSTANGVHQVLRSILRDALTEDLVRRNVAAVTKAPERSTKEEDYLDSTDAKALLKSLDPGGGAVSTDLALNCVAYLAGLRQGERLGLTDTFINMDERTITVSWSLTRLTYEHGCGDQKADGSWPCGRRKGGYCPQKVIDLPDNQDIQHVSGGLYLVRPKNPNAWRTVPMVGLLHEVMKVYLETHDRGPHGLVFMRDNGKTGKTVPISGDWESRHRHDVLDAAGLRYVRGHSARHTCNTLLIELDTADDVRFAIIGHAGLRSNATYTHTSDERKARALESIGRELDWRKDNED